MEPGIKLSVIWNDADMVELEIAGSNGMFAGVTRSYDNPDAAIEAANVLRGFPSNGSDVREIRLGQFMPNVFRGGANLRFFCMDAAGHTAAEVEIQSDERDGPRHSVRFLLAIEPAAIDIFVQQLQELQEDIYGKSAFLAMKK
jgi:hypothetical protein